MIGQHPVHLSGIEISSLLRRQARGRHGLTSSGHTHRPRANGGAAKGSGEDRVLANGGEEALPCLALSHDRCPEVSCSVGAAGRAGLG